MSPPPSENTGGEGTDTGSPISVLISRGRAPTRVGECAATWLPFCGLASQGWVTLARPSIALSVLWDPGVIASPL